MSIVLTILFSVLAYILGAVVGWDRTVRAKNWLLRAKRKAFAKTPEPATPAK
jgi:hypothetical protein